MALAAGPTDTIAQAREVGLSLLDNVALVYICSGIAEIHRNGLPEHLV